MADSAVNYGDGGMPSNTLRADSVPHRTEGVELLEVCL
jgi:hypothetical protein